MSDQTKAQTLGKTCSTHIVTCYWAKNKSCCQQTAQQWQAHEFPSRYYPFKDTSFLNCPLFPPCICYPWPKGKETPLLLFQLINFSQHLHLLGLFCFPFPCPTFLSIPTTSFSFLPNTSFAAFMFFLGVQPFLFPCSTLFVFGWILRHVL